jgi:hypothetical protein
MHQTHHPSWHRFRPRFCGLSARDYGDVVDGARERHLMCHAGSVNDPASVARMERSVIRVLVSGAGKSRISLRSIRATSSHSARSLAPWHRSRSGRHRRAASRAGAISRCECKLQPVILKASRGFRDPGTLGKHRFSSNGRPVGLVGNCVCEVCNKGGRGNRGQRRKERLGLGCK